MFKFMGNKQLVVFFVAIMFFVALMGFTLNVQGVVSWPEKFVSDTIAFGQQVVNKPVRWTADVIQNVREIRTIYEENQALRLTLAQYARDRARLSGLEYQNERLKNALEFTERQKEQNRYKYRIAEVISQSSDRYNRVIRINLGERNGILEDMAVTTVDGLIGRVVRVYPFSANVQLITDLSSVNGRVSGISATVQGKENRSFGIIESYDLEQGTLLMTKIEQEDPLQPSDVIVTSGLGELFPEGIVIGTVIERRVGDFGLTHMATIQPAATFNHLREVFVVEVPSLD
jgi:rod shape-determining protein MreC